MRTEEADSLVPGPHLLDEQDRCAGCGQELRDGQALVALDKQYHIWCFKCTGRSANITGGSATHSVFKPRFLHEFLI